MVESCTVVIMDCKNSKFYSLEVNSVIQPSCENIVLWRGHFNATGSETSANLTINGGEGVLPEKISVRLSHPITAFAASVWLNDVFLDTAFGK